MVGVGTTLVAAYVVGAQAAAALAGISTGSAQAAAAGHRIRTAPKAAAMMCTFKSRFAVSIAVAWVAAAAVEAFGHAEGGNAGEAKITL